MPRKEAVFLVSRALAVIWAIAALVEVCLLPQILFSAYRYLNLESVMDRSVLDASTYLAIYYGIILPLALIVRISLYLVAAVLFWRCGPMVARLFEPPSN